MTDNTPDNSPETDQTPENTPADAPEQAPEDAPVADTAETEAEYAEIYGAEAEATEAPEDDTPETPEDDAPETPARASGERIAKMMARAGVASRREAERMIVEGRVTVNGDKITSPALDILPSDKVRIDGTPMDAPQETRLWLYYKPVGLVTSEADEKGRQTVFDALPRDLPRVMSVGRLDLNSEGLLLLTNDGELKRRLELPSTGWLRRYRVRVNGNPSDLTFAPLRRGAVIDGEEFAPMEVKLDSQKGANAWLTVGIREGKNREIRRAMAHVGLIVNRLIRIGYGPFKLIGMEANEVREVKRRILRDQLGGLLTGEDEADEGARRPARGGPDKPRGPRRDDRDGAGFDRKPRGPRGEGEERREWTPRPPRAEGDSGFDRKPRGPRREGEERREWTPRPPRGEGDSSLDRKPRGPRREGEARREWTPRQPRSEGDGGFDRKPRAPRPDGGADRKPYGARRDDEGTAARKPRWSRDDRSAPRPARDEGDTSARRSYQRRDRDEGDTRPPRSGEGFDRKPRAPRPEGGERPGGAPRRGPGADRFAGGAGKTAARPDKPYRSRSADGPEKPYRPRSADGPAKPSRPRSGVGPEKPYGPRSGDGPTKPYRARSDGPGKPRDDRGAPGKTGGSRRPDGPQGRDGYGSGDRPRGGPGKGGGAGSGGPRSGGPRSGGAGSRGPRLGGLGTGPRTPRGSK